MAGTATLCLALFGPSTSSRVQAFSTVPHVVPPSAPTTASTSWNFHQSIGRTSPTTKMSFTTQLYLYASVEAAISEAERICAVDPDSNECRVAWDIVEELEAADSHRDDTVISPETVEAAAEVGMDTTALLGSFDILTHKIDTKMDQLSMTADQLHSMGAPGEMPELVRLAEEMKVALRVTRDALADL